MPARANAVEQEATRPVTEKSNGPSSFRQRQPAAARRSGTAASGQMIESSSAVRVIEVNGPAPAQSGTRAPGSSRQTANDPGSTENVRGGVLTPLDDEQRRQDQG